MNSLYDIFVREIGLKSFTVGFFFFGISFVLDSFHSFGLFLLVISLLKHCVIVFRHISLFPISLNISGVNRSGPAAFLFFSLSITSVTCSCVISSFFIVAIFSSTKNSCSFIFITDLITFSSSVSFNIFWISSSFHFFVRSHLHILKMYFQNSSTLFPASTWSSSSPFSLNILSFSSFLFFPLSMFMLSHIFFPLLSLSFISFVIFIS
ncbi:unnamed protein product [Meganyctiphanes norvegica]|uniref:Uncharacterized protein n=1 Tax=Meganyctiphanes norvegica TaxID=48144 RepID=A0AAV2Q5G7_MEGNR